MSRNSIKTFGQVFTPDWLVQKILDISGVEADFPQVKVLEPSFGEGAFLFPLVRNFISQSLSEGLTPQAIEQRIDRMIHGVELDPDLYLKTKNNLIDICSIEFGLDVPFSNLVNKDFLTYTETNFTHIIGNPPYVRIHNIPLEYRETFSRFKYSSGTSDLYILFFEHSLTLVENTGSITFITPNGFLKSASQSSFRKDLIDQKLMDVIVDFGSKKVFPSVSTYTAITKLNKANALTFIDQSMDSSTNTVVISYSNVADYTGGVLPASLMTTKGSSSKTLGTILRPRNGVATLADTVFVLDEKMVNEVESKVLRPAIKASTFKGDLSSCPKIIFPYRKDAGRYVGLTEAEMIELYPNAFSWLSWNKTTKLLGRASDKSALWFHYGRSQAIQQVSEKKLVLSPFVPPGVSSIKSFIIPEETVVYSGLFFAGSEKELLKVKEIFESEEFYDFARQSGKDLANGFKSISSKVVSSFRVD